MAPNENYSVIGKSRPRTDAAAQVAGRSKYVCDLHFDDMLYAKPVLSTRHHALIKSIDTSKALALPGVAGVITGEDVPEGARFGVTHPDQPAVAVGKVRFKGELVAMVAAETYEIACKAAELIEIEYEELPAVFDAREAMKPDAPIIHDDMQGAYAGNVLVCAGGTPERPYLGLEKGDIEKGFEEADFIIEQDFATPVQKAVPIEGTATIAWPDDQGGFTLWCNTQCVFNNAAAVAGVLQLPLAKVRIMAPTVGGGFGEKNQVCSEPATALLAKKVNRPVKCETTMEEALMWTGTRHPVNFHYKLGVKNDGTFTAIDITSYTGAGAYTSVAHIVTTKISVWGAGPYLIPNQRIRAYVVATNRQIGAAQRGFGMTQVTFAHETMVNMAAERLGMDHMEIRRKNLFVDGAYMSTGQAIRNCGIGMTLDKVAEATNWGK